MLLHRPLGPLGNALTVRFNEPAFYQGIRDDKFLIGYLLPDVDI